MMKSSLILARFLREENGASAAEYALLLAIIASGIAVAAVAAGTLGSAISNAMDNASNCIAEGPNCTP
jgi:pilus assembly protein Flp/PilA